MASLKKHSMATEPSQRTYRAPCPGCGAPVDFKSAQSTHAVCGFCQSTVVRDGDKLKRLGKMAELFDDHSPLQLQASGVWRQESISPWWAACNTSTAKAPGPNGMRCWQMAAAPT
jgi:hypothetical protein